MGKHLKTILVVLVIFVLVILVVQRVLIPPSATSTLTYSQFIRDVQQHKVKKVTANGHDLSGELSDQTKLITVTPPDDRDVYSQMVAAGVDVTVNQPTSMPVVRSRIP